MIRLEGVNKSFKNSMFSKERVEAVKNVSIQVKSGEIVGIAGESGSGKSTLARIISGLLKADSGKVFVAGKNIDEIKSKDIKDHSKQLQIIFQNPSTSLNPSKTIRQILLKPLRIHNIGSSHERENMVLNMLIEMGLDEAFLERYPHQISGGEAQRIMIGRSLLLDSKILILDEATSMLDVSVQAQIIQMLKRVHKDRKMTFIVISHDIDLLKWMCNRIYFMDNGGELQN